MSSASAPEVDQTPHARTEALDQPQAQRDFLNHLLVFVTGRRLWVILGHYGAGLPVARLPMVGWGLGLTFYGFDAFRRLFSEEEVQAEMQSLRHRG